MIDRRLLVITHTDCGIDELKCHGLGIGPVMDMEAVLIQPLRDVFARVEVFDLWRRYAEVGPRASNAELLAVARGFEPDIVLWPSMMYEVLDSTFAALRELGARVVGWFFDDEDRFDNYSALWAPLLWGAFTNDPAAVDKFANLGVPAVHVVLGSNPRVFRRLDVVPQYDVSFVGRSFPSRQQDVQAIRDAGIDVATFGRGWPAGRLSTERMVEVFNESRINLCFTKSAGAEGAGQMKDRIFHVPMAGGFLLCEAVPGVEDLFVPGREVVLFETLEEAVGQIEYYLAHDEERLTIRDAGWRRAQQDHTQASRMESAFAKLESLGANRRKPSGQTASLRKAAITMRGAYHLGWARALGTEGYPQSRCREEYLLSRADLGETTGVRLVGAAISLPRLTRPAALRALGAAEAVRVRAGREVREFLLEDHPGLGSRAKTARRRYLRVRTDFGRARLLANVQVRLSRAKGRAQGRTIEPFLAASRFADRCLIDRSSVAYRPRRKTSLTYCAVYRLLLGALVEGSGDASKREFRGLLDTVRAAQDPEDGLFKDPAVAFYNDDSVDWWGWRHLTAHAVNALMLFGERPLYPLHFARSLWPAGAVTAWLDSLDWVLDPASSSNAVMNYGVALQCERDLMDGSRAASAVEELFHWLDSHHDPETGTWGTHARTPEGRSLAVQTAYHMWVMYFYDSRPVPSLTAAIDACLATQTRYGGFGHLDNTSACEDIDSIQPLAWFSQLTDYRHGEIVETLRAAWTWCTANQMRDGGFVFRIGEPFAYGAAPEFRSGRDQSALFPTWFRALALAYIWRAVGRELSLPRPAVHFGRSPGYQSWFDPAPDYASELRGVTGWPL